MKSDKSLYIFSMLFVCVQVEGCVFIFLSYPWSPAGCVRTVTRVSH